MKRIIIATVQNGSVLNRVTGMLNKRQLNMESISVGPSETEGVSKMTFVLEGSDRHGVQQLIKQLNKQVDVLSVSDITDGRMVARELALIKVAGSGESRSEIQSMIVPFRASVIDVNSDSLTIQVTGNPDKVDALIALVRPYGIIDSTRTGVTALLRGNAKQVTDLNATLFV